VLWNIFILDTSIVYVNYRSQKDIILQYNFTLYVWFIPNFINLVATQFCLDQPTEATHHQYQAPSASQPLV
jgi:hypothetical protein